MNVFPTPSPFLLSQLSKVFICYERKRDRGGFFYAIIQVEKIKVGCKVRSVLKQGLSTSICFFLCYVLSFIASNTSLSPLFSSSTPIQHNTPFQVTKKPFCSLREKTNLDETISKVLTEKALVWKEWKQTTLVARLFFMSSNHLHPICRIKSLSGIFINVINYY